MAAVLRSPAVLRPDGRGRHKWRPYVQSPLLCAHEYTANHRRKTTRKRRGATPDARKTANHHRDKHPQT